ncbi:MAG: sigma factor [Planctomycetota bacterium]
MTADDSFQREYEEVAAPLAAWAHLRCRGPLGRVVDADDLVQEVVLAGWRAHERFDPQRGGFRAWLFGIASRVAAVRRWRRSSIASTNSTPRTAISDLLAEHGA